jgi:hypothetical protein
VVVDHDDKPIAILNDFNSGAMIENIVARAKKMAIKEFLETGQKGMRVSHLLAACVDEFSENEDLPNTTNPKRQQASTRHGPCDELGSCRESRSSRIRGAARPDRAEGSLPLTTWCAIRLPGRSGHLRRVGPGHGNGRAGRS